MVGTVTGGAAYGGLIWVGIDYDLDQQAASTQQAPQVPQPTGQDGPTNQAVEEEEAKRKAEAEEAQRRAEAEEAQRRAEEEEKRKAEETKKIRRKREEEEEEEEETESGE